MAMPSSPLATWAFLLETNDFVGKSGCLSLQKPGSRPNVDGFRGVLWLPLVLLEEGCHSTGFITTIHLRHHLLLSIGWRLIVVPLSTFKYCNDGSMSQFKLDVNGLKTTLIKL